MTYTPPAGSHVFATLSLDAQSVRRRAAPERRSSITDGVFVVTTTADSGPGSLRQAILDSNAVTGGHEHDRLRHPGHGRADDRRSSRPCPRSPTPCSIDGTTQPGYAGTPLIALGGHVGRRRLRPSLSRLAATSDGHRSTAWPSIGRASGDRSYRIDTTERASDRRRSQPQGLTTRLSLLDSQGQVLVQSDGLSPGNPDDAIDEHLAAGTYSLAGGEHGGAGNLSP